MSCCRRGPYPMNMPQLLKFIDNVNNHFLCSATESYYCKETKHAAQD